MKRQYNIQFDQLEKTPLFSEMKASEIEHCLKCSSTKIISYDKEEIIFDVGDTPKYLYILIEGSISVCKDSISGKRIIINNFENFGDLFGEVFLFLQGVNYENYTIVQKRSVVLEMPKEFFFGICVEGCSYHQKLIRNMLSILAGKAYILNRKLRMVSGTSLRQKIIFMLLENHNKGEDIKVSMGREQMADFLGTTRPSLSREIMKMSDEGLILVNGRDISVKDISKLESCL